MICRNKVKWMVNASQQVSQFFNFAFGKCVNVQNVECEYP